MSISPLVFTSANYLDVYRTVSAAMTSQNFAAPALNAASQSYKVAISDLGQLKSALASFQSAASTVTGKGLNLYTATPSTSGVVTATTSTTSVAGSYGIAVNALAQGQTLTSGRYASATAAIGAGATTTVNFEFGTTAGTTFTLNPNRAAKSVTINASNNSLQGIASAVNAANIGISANVTFDGVGYKLGFTSPTGSANSLRISVTGDAAIQGLLATDPAGIKNLTQTTAAQDASLSVNGAALTSATNSVTGAIAGTTLNLTAVGATNLVVTPDTTQIAKNITNFVSAFNSLQSTLKTLGSGTQYDANLIERVRGKLSATIASTPNGLTGTSYNSLAQIGISTQSDGTLAVNATKLQSAVAANPTAVSSLFSNNGVGIADKLVGQIGGFIGPGGAVQGLSAALTKASSSIDTRKTQLAGLLTLQAQGLVKNYSHLGSALSTYQNIRDILTSQFSQLRQY